MRVIYLFFLFTLFWSYWKALVRLRHKQFPLTPILGWMVGIGYFMLAPLTVLVFNGGYSRWASVARQIVCACEQHHHLRL